MADRSVRVVLSAQIADFQAKMAQAKSAADGFAKSLAANSQSADVVSTGLLKIGTVAALGFGFAVKTAADFDQAMSNVKATGQDAASNFDALRDAAIDMGAKTSFSATEAAAGVENLMKAGVSAKDVLGGGLSGALDLAAAGSLGVGEAAEIAATALTQFGLAGADVPHVADLLAAGAGKAQGEVADLGAALKQSGLVASQFGLSIEETVGGLSAFAAAGLLGSDAGTSLKTMLQRLAVQTPAAAKEMERLGISAYDASGNFVGLEGLAGQLKTSMSGLTPEARNAAMAIIFGSDAVRAANVLYENGAAGIAEWTAKVNDQGYAAETAATKLDNLKGDLEALGGSLETVLIKGGTGANDALRGIAQGATDVVNALGQVPTPVLNTGVALVGLLAAGGLAAGGLLKAYTTATELRAAMSTLAAAAPKTAAALAGVGKGAAIAAVAFIALTAAYSATDNMWKSGIVGARDMASTMATTTNAAADLNKAFQFEEGVLIRDRFTGIGESMKRALDPTPVQGFTDAINGIFTASMAERIRTQITAVDTALTTLATTGKGDLAAAQFRVLAAAAAESGVSVTKLVDAFPAYQKQLEATATSLDVSALSAQEWADWMGGKVPAAVQAAAKASTSADPAIRMLAGGFDAVAAAAADAELKTKKYLGVISDKGSQLALAEAADAATAAIKKNGKSLDEHTKSGQANWGILLGLAQAYQSVKGSTEQVAAGQADAAGKFLAAAQAAGATREEAAALAAEYLGIPLSVATAITAPGAKLSTEEVQALITATGLVPALTNAQVLAPGARPSKADVDALIGSIGSVPGLTEAQIRTIADLYGVEQARAGLASIQSKTVTITTRQVWVQVGGPIKASAVADGGLFANTGAGLVRSYASGGINAPRYVGSIGSRTNGVYPYAGKGGVIMNEEGSGPWEGIVSGHPAKRSRSRVITEEIARRLGGDVSWQFADGGFMGKGPGGKASGSDASAALAGAVRAALNGAELRLTGAVDTIGDAVAGRILLAYEGAV